ncbi:MAG: hypothetical protein QME71_10705 [Dehalococcoidia bacterium]|nr:hypothetical protein [Dehalococcoidia bacterium]
MPVRDYRSEGILLDARGLPLFCCRACQRPLTRRDFAELGLRLPDPGETAGEYCDEELIDDLTHFDCPVAARAG